MAHLFRRPLGVATLGLTLMLSTSAFAQDANQGAGDTYQPDYFAQYAPRTANDMIRQVPGFQINEGDNKRGLGQGGANVLINGERLTGKTSVFDQLSRINAKNVIRIEIVDGASLDIPGLSGQVANVFTKTTGISGTWEWEPEWRARLQPNLFRGEATISGESGNLAWSGKIQNYSFRNGNRGQEDLFTPDDIVFETRYEKFRGNGDNPGVSADLKWTPKEDHVANLNAEYNIFNYHGQFDSVRSALLPRGNAGVVRSLESEDEWNASVGADYEFPFYKGKLKTIGYYRYEHSPSLNSFEFFRTPTDSDFSSFEQVADEGEAIARTEYSWSPSTGRDWTLGVEGAFNFLDRNSVFTDNSDDTFPGQNRVEEKRAEATLTHSRKLSSKLDLQVSAGAEYSEISQMNEIADTASAREFVRPKGFLAATYKPNGSLTISPKIEREVGQLNFFDFISSVDLENDLGRDANPDLVPSQAWNFEVEVNKDFGGGNTLKVVLYDNEISDIVDRIPIGIDGDAVGNIDKARRYGIDVNATLKGDKWGLEGTQLDIEADYRWSEVNDPLTDIERRLNGDKKSYWFVEFRHDIPKTDWAYGIAVDRYRGAKVFQLSAIGQYDGVHPFGRAYIEHKDVFGLKIRAQAMNLFDAKDDFDRQFFTARRDQGRLDFTESNSRGFDMFYRMTVSGTF